MTSNVPAPAAGRGIHTRLLEHEMTGTGRTLSRGHELKVTFKGEQAMTAPGEIVFPAMPARELTNEEAMVARGFVDHEAAHQRHTDFAYGGRHLKAAVAAGNKVLHGLMQCAEDVRIEAASIREFPGSARTLAATAQAVDSAAVEPIRKLAADPNTDWRRIIPNAIAWAGRRAMGNGTPAHDELMNALPKNVRSFAEHSAQMALAAKSTKDTVALAKRLEAVLGALVDGKPENIPPKPGKPGVPQKDGGKGKGQGDKPKDDDGGSQQDGQGGDGQPQPKDGEADKDGGGDGQQQPGDGQAGGYGAADSDDNPLPTREDVISKMLGTTKDQRASADRYTVFDRSHDTVTTHLAGRGRHQKSMAEGRTPEGRQSTASHMAGMVGRVATMARKLELMLLSPVPSEWEGNLRHGRLDPKRLVHAGAFGRRDVFRRKHEAPKIDAVVSIVVDLSGSMDGRKARIAVDAALLLGQALDRCGIPFEVRGHKSSGKCQTADGLPPEQTANWGRTDTHHEIVAKDFDEGFRATAGSIHNLAACTGGGNVDTDAIYNATARLARRTEARRLLLIISDGRPAYYNTMGADAQGNVNTDHMLAQCLEATKRAAVEAERMGVCCIGIGILDDTVKHIYPRHAVVRYLDDMSGATLDQMAKALVGDHATVMRSAA